MQTDTIRERGALAEIDLEHQLHGTAICELLRGISAATDTWAWSLATEQAPSCKSRTANASSGCIFQELAMCYALLAAEAMPRTCVPEHAPQAQAGSIRIF